MTMSDTDRSVEKRAATTRAITAAVVSAAVAVLFSALPARSEISELRARDAAIALSRGDSVAAVDHYTAILAEENIPDDRRATLLNDRAVAYVRLGKTREAIEDYNKAVVLFPEYAAVYNNRGNLLMALGLHGEALKDFNRAIALAPGYAAAYNNRAGAQSRLGHADDAIRDYTRAIKLMPSSPAPLAGRGKAYLSQDRPHAAIRDFSRAVGADARFATGYRNRAEAKIEVAHYNEAIEDLSRAIAFDVANPEAYLLRGHSYLAIGDAPAAVTDFTRVIELAPSDTIGYEARGLANTMAEAFDAAFADLNEAIRLNPRSATAFAYRGFAYVRNGQPDIAQRDLDAAAALEKDNPEVLWALAESEEAQGRSEKAIEHLRRALAIKPDFKRAADSLQRLGFVLASASDTPVKGLGGFGWQVITNSGRFYAVSDNHPNIRVPLEPLGEGQPRILSWELKDAPFRDIGVLTYHGGVIEGREKPEEVELAAIIDLKSNSVVAIEPHRQGKEVSNWTWGENGRVTIASVDGVTDEFTLRQVRQEPTVSRYRQQDRDESSDPYWAPWNEGPWASDPSHRSRSASRARKAKKPKSFFQLLFGN